MANAAVDNMATTKSTQAHFAATLLPLDEPGRRNRTATKELVFANDSCTTRVLGTLLTVSPSGGET